MTAVRSNRALRACTMDHCQTRGSVPEIFSLPHCKGLILKTGEFPRRGIIVVDWTIPANANRRKPPWYANAANVDPPPYPPPIDSKPPDKRIYPLQYPLSGPHPPHPAMNIQPRIAKQSFNAGKILCEPAEILVHPAEILLHMAEILLHPTEILLYIAEILVHAAEILLYMAEILVYAAEILLVLAEILLALAEILLAITEILLAPAEILLSIKKFILVFNDELYGSGKIRLETICVHFKTEIIRPKLLKIIMALERTIKDSLHPPSSLPLSLRLEEG